MIDDDQPPQTVLPYGPGNRWTFRARGTTYEQTQELALYAEPNGAAFTDDYLPEEASAAKLWELWADEWADYYHRRWPTVYRPGEVAIFWFVTTPSFQGVLEPAPHVVDPRGKAAYDDWPAELVPTSPPDTFLTHFTDPVHAVTGEPLNWLRLPVLDRGWNATVANKGGFVQEATGWKPSPLQPTVDVRLLARAAGLHVPELKV